MNKLFYIFLWVGMLNGPIALAQSKTDIPNQQRLLADIKADPNTLEQCRPFKVSSIAEITNWKQELNLNNEKYTKFYSSEWRDPWPFDEMRMYASGNTKKDAKGQYYTLSFTVTYKRYYLSNDKFVANPEWVYKGVFVSVQASYYKKQSLTENQMLEMFNQHMLSGKIDWNEGINNDYDLIYFGKPLLTPFTKKMEEENDYGLIYFKVGVPVQKGYFARDKESLEKIEHDTLVFELSYKVADKFLTVKRSTYSSFGFNRKTDYLFEAKKSGQVYDTCFMGFKEAGFEKLYLHKVPKKASPDGLLARQQAENTFKLLLLNVLSKGIDLNEPEQLQGYIKEKLNYDQFIAWAKDKKKKKMNLKDVQLSEWGFVEATLFGTAKSNSTYSEKVQFGFDLEYSNSQWWVTFNSLR